MWRGVFPGVCGSLVHDFVEDASVALVYLGPFAVGVDWGAWFADFAFF